MPQNVFAVNSFNPVLVLSGQILVNSSRFKAQHLENVVMEFKQLACELVHLQHDGLGYLLRFLHAEDLVFGLDWLQIT